MKHLFAFSLLLPGLLLAETAVTLHESASLKVEPDTMRTTLAFDALSQEEAPIAHAFNSVIKSVKRANEQKEALECRGGSYRITPRYSWANKKQTFDGYSGSLSFSCEFSQIDAYNRLSQELDTHLNAWPDLKRRQGGVIWAVSQKREQQTQLKLERMLIKRIERKAEHLSKAMGQRCTTRSILFDGTPSLPMPLRMMKAERMEMAAAPIETPILDDETLICGATVTYGCE
jgi:predicted secreted protein